MAKLILNCCTGESGDRLQKAAKVRRKDVPPRRPDYQQTFVLLTSLYVSMSAGFRENYGSLGVQEQDACDLQE